MKKSVLITIILGLSLNIFAQSEWFEKGNTQYELMQYRDAVDSYQKYLKYNSTDKQALLRLAECYDYIYDWDNAAKWYYEALGKSVSADYLLKHGMIQMRLGRYEAAKEQFLIYSSINAEVGNNYIRMCDYAYSKKNIPSLFQVAKLPINTAHAEFSPAFFGSNLIYASDRKDIQRTDATDGVVSAKDDKYNFLMISPGGGTGVPGYVRSWFHDNDLINEGPISYSADRKWVAYVKNNYVAGVSKLAYNLFKEDIYIARVTESGDWEKGISFPYNGAYSNNFPHLSEDGNTLYFSSNMEGGEGGFDIYMSVKQNGVWSPPRNMGYTINKKGNEISPYIDGDDFYFSSDYQIGFGGQDIFRANFSNGIWKIQNLGTGVNSSSNDYNYIFRKDNNIGYFVSDRDQGEDIYKAVKTSDDINLVVLDASTQSPVPGVTLDFKNCGKEIFKTNQYGQFGFKASVNLSCWIEISKLGYEKTRLDLDKHSKSKGLLEVRLFKEGEMYQGKVVDGINDVNLNVVRIQALNQSDGTRIESYSSSGGIYALALKSSTTYMIQFSKLGYLGVGTKVETGDGSDKGILGSQLLFPTDNIGEGPAVPSIPSPSTLPAGGGISPTVPSPTTPNIGSMPAASVGKGYAVQLMSLSKTNNKFPEKINILKGNVDRLYMKTDDKWKRYRIGTFNTKAEAEKVRSYVKSKGFGNAYIVEEDAMGLIETVF
ncbi:MAG: hypothetical protein ACI94Y_000929 [Maribacter sp.]|jgi:hypothetical protein